MQHPAENPVSAHMGRSNSWDVVLLFTQTVMATNTEFSAIHLAELLRTSLLYIVTNPTRGKPRAINTRTGGC